MSKANAFIFARGGSKGLPKKNILKINGRPLIAYSISTAKKSELIENVFLSSDDQEILDIGSTFGAIPIKRPSEFSQDNTPELEAWKHAIKYVYRNYGIFDIFVSLPPTSPLRRLIDVNKSIKLLEEDCDIVFTMKKSSPPLSSRGRFFRLSSNNVSPSCNTISPILPFICSPFRAIAKMAAE